MKFIVYTDGACLGNRRDGQCPGGYGYLVLDEDMGVILSGGGKRKNVTNNIMEMIGVIKGLEAIREEMKEVYDDISVNTCVVRTDSKYISDNYDTYIDEWKANGWRKSNGGRIINKNLWKELEELTRGFKAFRFEWVKAHFEDRHNMRVDEIATGHARAG